MHLVHPRYVDAGFMWFLLAVSIFVSLYGSVGLGAVGLAFSTYALLVPRVLLWMAARTSVEPQEEELRLFPRDEDTYTLTFRASPSFLFGIVRLSAYLQPTAESDGHAFWRQERLVSGDAQTFHLHVRALKRGPIQLGSVGIELRDPLRLFSLYREVHLPRLGYVFPSFGPYRLPNKPQRLPGQQHTRLSPYRTPERNDTLAPYQGQSAHQLYWSAFAKTGELLAWNEQTVESNEYVIVLDVLTRDGRSLTRSMDRLISETATLCRKLEQEQASYGLIVPMVTSEGVTYDLQPGSGDIHFRNVMVTLATLSERDFPLSKRLFEQKLKRYDGGQTLIHLREESRW